MKELKLDEGWAVWITGLPSSGKSTIAGALKKALERYGVAVQVLESDEVRKILTPKPNYSEEERDIFYRSLAYVGELLVINGVNVIFDATANKRKYREEARSRITKFIEVYVKCPLDICVGRDAKGIYRRAAKGETETVPGLQTLYEEPLEPDLTLDSVNESPQEAAERILDSLKIRRFLKG